MTTKPLVSEGSPLEGIPTLFQNLRKTAVALNAASDDLGKTVELLDAALSKLNLGVMGWVEFDGYSDEHCNYTSIYLGYMKLTDRWGLCIKKAQGNYNDPENEIDNVWYFSDASRELRVKAIEAVPKLIEELDRLAKKMIDSLTAKTKEAKLLALVMHSLPTEKGAQ